MLRFCVFSAKGAASCKAWGIAPRIQIPAQISAESASQFGRRAICKKLNRAFSADPIFVMNPGTLSQADIEHRVFGANGTSNALADEVDYSRLAAFQICRSGPSAPYIGSLSGMGRAAML